MEIALLFALLFVTISSCANITHKDVTPRPKTRILAVICASHLSSTVAHFDALIDLFCFKQINKNVFIDNTEDKKAIQAFYDVFEEQRKNGAIEDFEEKWGTQLAVYLASFYLSHVDPNSLPQLQAFISTVSQLPRKDSGLASMAAIRDYLKLEELPDLIMEWEAALIFFLMQIEGKEGRNVGESMVAAMFPGSGHMLVVNFLSQPPLSESGIRSFCEYLFEDIAVPAELHDSIMQKLDSLVPNIHIYVLLGERRSPPKNYADFLNIVDAIGQSIYWHSLASSIVDLAIGELHKTCPELAFREATDGRLLAALEKLSLHT